VLETSGAYFSVQFNITALRLVTEDPFARSFRVASCPRPPSLHTRAA
jgi:hypothetical protein